MYVTETFSEYLATYSSAALPPDLRLSAACCIVDAVTAYVVGCDVPSARAAREVARYDFKAGRASVWFTGKVSVSLPRRSVMRHPSPHSISTTVTAPRVVIPARP